MPTRPRLAFALASALLAATAPTLAEHAPPAILPIEILAHNMYYATLNPGPLHSRWETYANPQVDCVARDEGDILVVARERVITVDGATGLLRGSFVHKSTGSCAMAAARFGSQKVIVLVRQSWADGDQKPYLALSVLTHSGEILAVYRTSKAGMDAAVDLGFVGNVAFFNQWDSLDSEGPVRTLDLSTLKPGPSFDIADYSGLFDDGHALYAMADQGKQAWRLHPQAAPVRAPRPGGATRSGISDPFQRGWPVRLPGRDLFASIDYPKPTFDVKDLESIVLRDARGNVVAQRMLGSRDYDDYSFVVPWDDGLRIIAQGSPIEGFQVWKVPIRP